MSLFDTFHSYRLSALLYFWQKRWPEEVLKACSIAGIAIPEKNPAVELYHLAEKLLRPALRSAPYWIKGHFVLAELALAAQDTATTYASIRALEQLDPTFFASFPVQKLLATCYLRSGQKERAAAIFAKWPDKIDAQEHRMVLALAENNLAQAKELLQKIPEAGVVESFIAEREKER